MFRISAAVFGLVVLAAPAFAEPGPAEGGAIYETRCKMCHSGAIPTAPAQDKLALLENDRIVDMLTNPTGMMASAVGGISDEDKRNIAVFLTGKTMPAKGSLPEVKAN
jgi:polyvinyl alcohol dehydrogenase (cytochrome)